MNQRCNAEEVDVMKLAKLFSDAEDKKSTSAMLATALVRLHEAAEAVVAAKGQNDTDQAIANLSDALEAL
jgi:hypothetical protein